MSVKANLVVLISGNGSNLQALIDACEAKVVSAEIQCVISNRPAAFGLKRAERHHIPTAVFYPQRPRDQYDADLADFIRSFDPDWIVLAGWMHLLSMAFLRHFPNRVVNLHPALPGQFPGMHAIERAFELAQQGKIDQTGVMVHLVPDEGVDDGPILATHIVPILLDDTLDDLENRIHAVEHQLLVETIRKLVIGELDNSL